MVNKREKELTDLATSRKDVDLALVVGGKKSLWEYLETKVDKDDKLPDSKRTILSRIRANGKRANQLEGWIRKETNDDFKTEYQKELDIITEIGYMTLLNLYGKK